MSQFLALEPTRQSRASSIVEALSKDEATPIENPVINGGGLTVAHNKGRRVSFGMPTIGK